MPEKNPSPCANPHPIVVTSFVVEVYVYTSGVSFVVSFVVDFVVDFVVSFLVNYLKFTTPIRINTSIY